MKKKPFTDNELRFFELLSDEIKKYPELARFENRRGIQTLVEAWDDFDETYSDRFNRVLPHMLKEGKLTPETKLDYMGWLKDEKHLSGSDLLDFTISWDSFYEYHSYRTSLLAQPKSKAAADSVHAEAVGEEQETMFSYSAYAMALHKKGITITTAGIGVNDGINYTERFTLNSGRKLYNTLNKIINSGLTDKKGDIAKAAQKIIEKL